MTEVQLYIRKIEDPNRITAEEISTLQPCRQERIRKMKSERGRAALFTAGILLRDVLGISKDEDLVFSEKGKPFLRSGASFFSISHNDTFAVLAAAPAEVGADVENRKELSGLLIKRAFTEEERAFIEKDPGRNAICMWTRLEAALKLSGEGISGIDRRTFSLLQDSDSCFFDTMEYEDSVISVACREKFSLSVHIL